MTWRWCWISWHGGRPGDAEFVMNFIENAAVLDQITTTQDVRTMQAFIKHEENDSSPALPQPDNHPNISQNMVLTKIQSSGTSLRGHVLTVCFFEEDYKYTCMMYHQSLSSSPEIERKRMKYGTCIIWFFLTGRSKRFTAR